MRVVERLFLAFVNLCIYASIAALLVGIACMAYPPLPRLYRKDPTRFILSAAVVAVVAFIVIRFLVLLIQRFKRKPYEEQMNIVAEQMNFLPPPQRWWPWSVFSLFPRGDHRDMPNGHSGSGVAPKN